MTLFRPGEGVVQRPLGQVAPVPARVAHDDGVLSGGLCVCDGSHVREEAPKPVRRT
jgi:hypothetical protein